MRLTLILAAACATLALGACNTVAGLGRDMQAAGEAVTGTAEEVRR